MKAPTFALAALALPIVPPVASAQTWVRADTSQAYTERSAARSDGTLVDLMESLFFDTPVLKVHGFDGETQSGVELTALFGGHPEVVDGRLLPDDRVALFGGHVAEDGQSFDPWIGVVDPATGLGGWHLRFDRPDRAFTSGAATADGIWAIGSNGAGGFETLAKFGFDGEILIYQDVQLASASLSYRDAVALPDGGLLTVLRDASNASHLVAFDAEGDFAWRWLYDTFRAEAAVVVGDDQVWIAGETKEDQQAILALSTGGQKLWAKEYVGLPAVVRSVATDGSGTIVVAGSRILTDTFLPYAMAIDGQGELLWNRMYERVDGPSPQAGIQAFSVGERGWILRTGESATHLLTALDPSGQVDSSCVTTLDLASLVQEATFGPDEPSDVTITPAVPNAEPWVLQPLPFAGELDLLCGDPCSVGVESFGVGVAGSGLQIPLLDGLGGACAGTPNPRIELTRGLGGTFGNFGYSVGSGSLPLFGGTVYLNLQAYFLLPVVLDGAPGVPGAGSWSLEVQSNLVNLMGLSLTTQAFLFDPAAPQGWSMTQGLSLLID